MLGISRGLNSASNKATFPSFIDGGFVQCSIVVNLLSRQYVKSCQGTIFKIESGLK